MTENSFGLVFEQGFIPSIKMIELFEEKLGLALSDKLQFVNKYRSCQICGMMEICEYIDQEWICNNCFETDAFENRIKFKKNYGFVYVISLGNTGYYKIGHTNNMDRRLTQFSLVLPEEPEIIHTIETGDRIALEAELHERFKDKRANGEWFMLNQDDIDYIKGL